MSSESDQSFEMLNSLLDLLSSNDTIIVKKHEPKQDIVNNKQQEYHKLYNIKNKDTISEKKKQYYQLNKERIKNRVREYKRTKVTKKLCD